MSYEKQQKPLEINKKQLTCVQKYDIFKIYKRKMRKKESGFMLNDEICKLREKLNDSIVNGEDYEVTYQISVELDQLIAEYYKIELELKDGKIKKSPTSKKSKLHKKLN